jgi:hypothetical protein
VTVGIAHFDEGAMEEVNADLPAEFWGDDVLQQLEERHRADFESADRRL